jgi:enolase
LNFKIQPNDGSQKKSAAQMLELYREFCSKYPIITIEDPFEQDDWEPATAMTGENICQVRHCACV